MVVVGNCWLLLDTVGCWWTLLTFKGHISVQHQRYYFALGNCYQPNTKYEMAKYMNPSSLHFYKRRTQEAHAEDSVLCGMLIKYLCSRYMCCFFVQVLALIFNVQTYVISLLRIRHN